MSLRLAHAVVYVRDLDEMLDFYCGVLGFDVTDRGPVFEGGPDIVFLSQAEDHHQLAFLPLRKGDDRPNSVDHIAFRVDSLDELRVFVAAVESDGRATELRPLSHGNAWSLYLRDPELNGIELFVDTPWHVAQPQGQAISFEWDDAELREWTEKTFGEEPGFSPIEDYYAGRQPTG